jgi:two-component system response regulator RegA
MSSEGRTLLIVDDDAPFRDRLVRAMRARGFDARGAADHRTAIEGARADSPELALVDLRLGLESGVELVRELKDADPSTVVVVLTGYGSIATAVESMKAGAATYLTKPADADQIVAAFDGVQPQEPSDVPSLARVEWEHIQRVLQDCGGNVSQAARTLGLHRRSLQRKLLKFPPTR